MGRKREGAGAVGIWDCLMKGRREGGGEVRRDGRSAGVHSRFLKAQKNFG